MKSLSVSGLHVEVEGKEILKGVDLEVGIGEVVALMGPNGAGKSSLGYVLLGHPNYKVTRGSVKFKGKDILNLPPNERSKLGLFLSFQYPSEIPGVSVANFIRSAVNAHRKKPLPVSDFLKELKAAMKSLKIDDKIMHRYLNDGFSGGEKKRAEILQMAMLRPKLAVLDETDSGLDVDSLKVVASGINSIKGTMGVLLITHYQRILDFVKPDRVYVMKDGKIVKTGGPGLVSQIEAKGYESI